MTAKKPAADELAREALERARFLQRKTDLTEREARAVAYTKLGFSPNGVAKRIGSSEGTVKTYLECSVESPECDGVIPDISGFWRPLAITTPAKPWLRIIYSEESIAHEYSNARAPGARIFESVICPA